MTDSATDSTGGTAPVVHDPVAAAIELEAAHVAHTYAPLPVVLSGGEGAWVHDMTGRRYLDCLAAYSAVNFGHANPRLLAVAHAQLDRLTLTSRAFHSDQLGPFARDLAALAGADRVLPMNTGAEAVESAIKVARAWGYRVKGVRDGAANVVVAAGNFHGRTTTVVGFSDDPTARAGFGPFTPGFRIAPYGDLDALAALIDDDTVAVLLEPVQGEAGVIIPPDGYLAGARRLTTERGALLVLDEIQSGLGRTGATFECRRVGVRPDLMLLGKALGGGVVPVSAVVGRADVLDVLRPGEHGSTFGGNPLAAAVGREVVAMLTEGAPQAAALERGAQLRGLVDPLIGHGLTAIRSVGLWFGLDVDPAVGTAREVCLRLLERGVLAKDTHGATVRLAPPLVITAPDVEWLATQLRAALVPGAWQP